MVSRGEDKGDGEGPGGKAVPRPPVREDYGHSVINIAGRQRKVVKGKPIDDYEAELNKSVARHPANFKKKKKDDDG